MPNANTAIYDSTIDRAAMIRLYEKRVRGKVAVELDGHIVRLDKLIKEAKGSYKGFKRLREAIDQELSRTYTAVNRVVSRSLIDLAKDQLSYTYQNLEKVMGHIWRTKRPYRKIAENIVLKRPLHSDKTLAQGWAGVSKSERIRLTGVIRKGLADGKSINEIALMVRKGNIHRITRNQSRALVVTSITSVHSQMDQEIYEANKKAIIGWQYVAVLDSRTTPLCAHRDGTIYPTTDTSHLPPAHFNCRSTTVPVLKSWKDMSKLEGVAQIRRRNLKGLSKKKREYYDGLTPMRESYNAWLLRQSKDVQLRHLGDYQAVEKFRTGQIELKKFTTPKGASVGIRDLAAMTTNRIPGDTKRFAIAKEKLDAMRLGISTPDDLYHNKEMINTLRDYYLLQAKELDGTLSLTNYRGVLIRTKAATKRSVLSKPPTAERLKFNPITRRYEDVRMYQPSPQVLSNSLKLVRENEHLLERDKRFISSFIGSLKDKMSVNERAVVTENLRNIFLRYRKNPTPYTNFKAVVQAQLKFDAMNISDNIETYIRRENDGLKRLLLDNYIDPVLGPTQLDDLHDSFISNIKKKNKWEDSIAPKIAYELRGVPDSYITPLFTNKFKPVLDLVIAKKAPIVWKRLGDDKLQQFYLRVAHRLALADTPDRDQFAVTIGRDLYNLAGINGNRKKWYNLGMSIVEHKRMKKFYDIETFGVQKRRLRSRMSGAYFGPYYDTTSYNIRITDKRIQDYAQLSRKVEVGLRVGVTTDKNRLRFREGFKTYFIKDKTGYIDTRIPITSTSSYSDFPEEFIDKNLVDALNWASKSKYKIDEDFYDFIHKLMYFRDDKGKAKYFNNLNNYKKYMASRGDVYERFKAMEWARKGNKAFSNHPFIDHRGRVYERGLIGPQSGETFRPFLNTAEPKNFSKEEFFDYQDQIGAFLGGLDDYFEGRYSSLTITGRQKIAAKWRPELIKIGNHMLRAKPNDIRAVLENPFLEHIDGEDQGKVLRFAIESAKLDKFLNEGAIKHAYSEANLERLKDYKISLALEQDASSSGAQIIALTTKNKQLANMSNVVPTDQKRRLYDEIAAATFSDPEFIKINQRLGITEKDLRKAAKMQNMVTLYGAGERTGILNVEKKLAKVLDKGDNVLVIKASDRDNILNEISAKAARYERLDPDTARELKALRANVRDVFNKGISPSDTLLEQLYFLDQPSRELVQKLTSNYDLVVTPNDFKNIAKIMSKHLAEEVPILKIFTNYFGRLAEDYLKNAKPSKSNFDWKSIAKAKILGNRKKGYTLPAHLSTLLGIRANEPLSEKLLKRFGFWKPNRSLADIIYGVKAPDNRRSGAKYFKFKINLPSVSLKKATLGKEKKLTELEIFTANKLPKSWTNVPSVNFDSKVVEQNFTQKFEEKLVYKDKEGNWVTNILQVPQKTEASWWEQAINDDGKINDIADVTKAHTAFGVNANHSNDATLVKKYHLWGKKEGIATSTIHDAFFANAADMLKGRKALRGIYADTLDSNVIKKTLDEMLSRGLPKDLYEQYLNEAIDKGLIPVAGRSNIGGKVLKDSDILKKEDILIDLPTDFKSDYGWYGVG